MDIHQLSIRYDADQDRILVRINTSTGDEVQMWLTRRLVLRLSPLLNRVAMDHLAIPENAKSDGYVDLSAMGSSSRKMLADARKQEVLQGADFKTAYRSDSTNRPLGDVPLLVTEVNLTPKDGAHMQMNFKELLQEPASSRGFQLDIPADLVFGLMELLNQALQKSDWQIGHAASAPLRTLDAEAEEIDMAPDATRPTYLN
ncbi:MAG: hypothetical protein V4858_15200 [Pseudomonadota bacterium]